MLPISVQLLWFQFGNLFGTDHIPNTSPTWNFQAARNPESNAPKCFGRMLFNEEASIKKQFKGKRLENGEPFEKVFLSGISTEFQN